MSGFVALMASSSHLCYHSPVTDFGPGTYGDSFADVYDDWYHDISDPEATADFVVRRVGPGPVLELGVGSGRLVQPLINRGLAVVGIDASGAMLERCQAALPQLALVQADLASLPIGGCIGGALCAFNTLFNLPSAEAQAALLRSLAAPLHPQGAIVIEALTGSALADGPRSSVGVSRLLTDRVVLSATVLDPTTQQIRGQHIDISEAGIRLRPWLLRWTTPEQLDGLADSVGLRLTERFAGWLEEPFTPESDGHVSVYRPRS